MWQPIWEIRCECGNPSHRRVAPLRWMWQPIAARAAPAEGRLWGGGGSGGGAALGAERLGGVGGDSGGGGGSGGGRRLVDQRPGAFGHDFGHEGGGAGDPNLVDQVVFGYFPPGGALGADCDRAAAKYRREQFVKWRRIGQPDLLGVAGQGEPGGLASEPERHRHTARHGRRRHVERLIAALGLVLAGGQLDNE